MRNRGFTLLEVVLAIGMAGAVLGLLATAINLYLVRVDTSRTEVETAQLARALLNKIAEDLCAARYYAPSSGSSSSDPESEVSGTDDSDSVIDPTTVQGIFGTATELRIDRAAAWQWDQQTRQSDTEEFASLEPEAPLQNDMPQTVRYILGEGQELLAAELAETGVSDDSLAVGNAGLYREQVSTGAWMLENAEGMLLTNRVDTAELIAPEVVDITFSYFDGEQLLTEWDSSVSESLPLAVEIQLSLLKEPFEQAATRTPADRDELRSSQENLVEYRLVVKLPELTKQLQSNFPQPIE